jgi:polynucleotide 5'-hydroxyl-kinase GRC3/NOL9
VHWTRDASDADRLREVIDAAAEAAVVLIIGESDTGKTTLVTALANAAFARGGRVGVVDADLGQSEIGPPTTIGLGRVRRPLGRLGDAEPIALEFVGVTSPAGNVLGTVVGVRRLLDRARSEGLDHVIVDTSGLVAGALGRVLKQAKIDLLDPDLVVCPERAKECEAIVASYAGMRRPRVLRVPVPASVRSRSAQERRRHREERLRAHFATSLPVALDIGRVVVRLPGGEVPASPAAIAEHAGALAGLHDAERNVQGLAVLRGLDRTCNVLHIETSVDVARTAAVSIGRERYEG